MNSWQKSASIFLIALLALSCIESFFSKAAAAQVNPKYAGTKSIDDSLEIKFSKYNNSVIYLVDEENINFSVGFGRYCFYNYMSLGAWLYSVSYKVSWQSEPVAVYNWSYKDPANLNDDNPNPQQSFQGTVRLKDAPLGNHQITVNALAGDYVTDFKSYWIYTVDTTVVLNFTVVNQPSKTPSPTFSYESDILWRTDIPWNLTSTPAQNKWDTEISGKSRDWTNPVIDNGVVYAGATSDVYLNQYGRPEIKWIDIYAFDATSGEQIWDYHATFRSITDLAVADGKVYFGAEASWNSADSADCLNALDAANGNILWTTPCSIFYSTPVTENGRVCINSGHSVLALNDADGKILWNYTASDIIVSPPTVANGVLYVTANDASFYALNIQDGRKLWSYKTNREFVSVTTANSVVNGVLYLPSDDGNIYALNAETGAKIWSHNTTPPEFTWVNYTGHSTPVYYNGELYFTSYSEQHIHNSESSGPDFCQMKDITSVYALDASNGNKKWNYTVNNCQLENPVAVQKGIVFTQKGNSIVGFNAQNGVLTWNFTLPDLCPISQPVSANGIIYIGFSDGQLYALRAPTAIGIQVENQSQAFVTENQNTPLLIIIIAVLALSLTTLTLIYRNKHSKQ